MAAYRRRLALRSDGNGARAAAEASERAAVAEELLDGGDVSCESTSDGKT
jgi:hypothetical protein